MLTKEQRENIRTVYLRLLDSEVNGWDKIDTKLEMLDFLSDKEIIDESDILYSNHKNNNVGCPWPHPKKEKCPVLDILESVDSILELYNKEKYLPAINRYILSYYLALYNMGLIVELP